MIRIRRMIKPGGFYVPKLDVQVSKTFSRQYKKHRKIKNKMAYRSRRINRLRCA